MKACVGPQLSSRMEEKDDRPAFSGVVERSTNSGESILYWGWGEWIAGPWSVEEGPWT